MVLGELCWIWSAVGYWGNCVGYGLLYGTGGIVLDMVCCMVLGEFPKLMKMAKKHINCVKKTHHSATFSTSVLMWIGFNTEPCLPWLC